MTKHLLADDSHSRAILDVLLQGYDRSCNTLDLQNAKEQKDSKADTKRELERYLHCFNRYQNHRQGQEFAEKTLTHFVEMQDDKE